MQHYLIGCSKFLLQTGLSQLGVWPYATLHECGPSQLFASDSLSPCCTSGLLILGVQPLLCK